MLIRITSRNFLLILLIIIFINLLFIKHKNREGFFKKKKWKKVGKSISNVAKDAGKGIEDVAKDVGKGWEKNIEQGFERDVIQGFERDIIQGFERDIIHGAIGTFFKEEFDKEYQRKQEEKERKEKYKKWVKNNETLINNLNITRYEYEKERNETLKNYEDKKQNYEDASELLDSYILDQNLIKNKIYINELILDKFKVLQDKFY